MIERFNSCVDILLHKRTSYFEKGGLGPTEDRFEYNC